MNEEKKGQESMSNKENTLTFFKHFNHQDLFIKFIVFHE